MANEDLYGYVFTTTEGDVIRVREEREPAAGYVGVDVFDADGEFPLQVGARGRAGSAAKAARRGRKVG